MQIIEKVERIQFFTGQRLFASDMQTLTAFNREMRWRHNQSLHQPGIGMGFSVSGNVGDRELAVAPGYTIDSRGREIVLTERRLLSIPPIADDGFGNPVNYDLAISYSDEGHLKEAPKNERIQLSNDADRLVEDPVFHWVELDQNFQPKDDSMKADIKNGLKIIIKRLAVQNCQIKHIYIDLIPRKAHPEKLPRIFAGKTDPQDTNWKFWKEGGIVIGLKAEVDTSEAKFNTFPHYSARVAGERFYQAHFNEDVDKFLLEGFVNISIIKDIPFERKFEFRLLMPEIDETNYLPPINPSQFFDKYKYDIPGLRKFLNWHIVWMGIEE